MLVHLTANRAPYALDWVHIRGQGRLMKCVNRLLLSEFSHNASSVRSGVIVHKDMPVNQWMIIKKGCNVCAEHVVTVCNTIEVTL
jgi:hypothetical protein